MDRRLARRRMLGVAGPSKLACFLAVETHEWGKVVRTANVKAE
jgi:hypothetical protein